MYEKLKNLYFYKIFTFIFYAVLMLSLFSIQGTPFAHAQGTNVGYEVGDLPVDARPSLIRAIQFRPSGILDNGTYFVVGHYDSEGSWGIGHLAAAVGTEPPAWETSVWFIVYSGTPWQVALQGTSSFDNLLVNLPPALKMEINPQTPNAASIQAATTFRFPWDKSQVWRYTFGWHGNTNLAVDFAPSNVTPDNMWILASAAGTVTRVCGGPNFDTNQVAINLTTPNGVMTYRHVDYNSWMAQNLEGKKVVQGQKLALLYNGTQGSGYRDISTPYPFEACVQGSSPSCIYIQFLTTCGSGSAAHVHWTLPTKPVTVDGWQIDSSGLWTQSGQPSRNVGASFNSTNSSSFLPSTFEDVPSDYWAWQYVERLYTASITGGCVLSPLQYCPDSTVTRAQMAIFLLKGIHGSSYAPPAVGVSTGFGDVATDYWAAAWIKQLAAEGITSGCGGGSYCPDSTVTRAQMAIFLLKARNGSSYAPPVVGVSTGFTDVAADYWAAAFIKQLVAEGITAGCGNGGYCPDSDVTRAQMAVFLVNTFNLP